MRPEVRKLLYDVWTALEELDGFLGAASREDFLQSRLLQVAAERELEIIGEALNRLYRLALEAFTKIEHGVKIIGMRNTLAHGYDVIDYRIIWSTLQEDIPFLRKQIAALMEE